MSRNALIFKIKLKKKLLNALKNAKFELHTYVNFEAAKPQQITIITKPIKNIPISCRIIAFMFEFLPLLVVVQ